MNSLALFFLKKTKTIHVNNASELIHSQCSLKNINSEGEKQPRAASAKPVL